MKPAALRPILRPAVLLDRDGTIIVEKHYLSDPDGVALEQGAAEGLRRLQAMGFVLAGVTNQSGIGRGKFTADDAHAVNARVDVLLATEGVEIARWYLCPHAPDVPCRCRKPLPGMALEAAQDLGLDLARSFVIGDKRSDAGLALATGSKGILVTTGHGRADEPWARENAVPVCRNLVDAAAVIEQLRTQNRNIC